MQELKKKIGNTDIKSIYIFVFVFIISLSTFILLWLNHYKLPYVVNMSFLLGLISLIALVDFKTKVIPNELILIGICFRIIMYLYYFLFTTISPLILIFENVIAGTICGLVFFLGRVFKMGVGAGDIKMYFVIGLYLGLSGSFNALFYTVMVMFIFSVIGLASKKLSFKDELAVGPFVLIGLLAMIIFSL